MKDEIKSLTGLRGIAAFYVMIYHYFHTYLINFYEKEPNILIYYLRNFISQGYLAVDLFFMLSSYVLCLRYANEFSEKVNFVNYKYYMFKRFKRIYPLYIFSLLFIICIFNNFNIYDFIIDITFLQAYFDTIIRGVNVPSWSLSIEWSIYLILPFLIYYWNKIKLKYHFVFALISLVLLYQCQYLDKYVIDYKNWSFYILEANEKINIHIGPLALFRAIVAYYFGFLIFKSINKSNILLFTSSTILILIELIFNVNDILIIIPLAIFIHGLIFNKTLISRLLSSKILNYLGQISFSLYLFHIIILNTIFKYNFLNIPENSFKIFLLSIIISLVFSCITYELIEKKLTQFLFKK
ncbi:acyltransferase family protein [Empedobacter stercoris]|uniref:acyltransferase family protein n=1 Tax=Empedobacter stercoris TaxID=1628248 RepID=UPI0037BE2919